jgi:predicted alpha/beta superfamily hydrolase
VIDLEEFQVRGVSGSIKKVRIGKRTVDYWAPKSPGKHIIVAFDGQNVLDKRNIGINPHQRATWELAQSAVRIAEKNNVVPPTVICVYHTPYNEDKLGRLKEYTPKRFMEHPDNWMTERYGLYNVQVDSFLTELDADQLIADITETIAPQITERINQNISPESTAIIGASMGGLAAIYSTIERPDFFHTSLSFSPHWIIGGNPLANTMMMEFPNPGKHKLWMSRGTKGLDSLYEESQNLADSVIKSRGYRENSNLISRVLRNGAHSNATWAKFAPAALDFWLKEGI